jgi:hypothetical protein
MKKESIAYYTVLFAAGAAVAWYFNREYIKLKNSPKRITKPTVFGVRG